MTHHTIGKVFVYISMHIYQYINQIIQLIYVNKVVYMFLYTCMSVGVYVICYTLPHRRDHSIPGDSYTAPRQMLGPVSCLYSPLYPW